MRNDKITRQQWRAFAAAWLGWAFDGLDGYLYVLVAQRFVAQLMPGAGQAEVVAKASLVQGVFLIGWACGGVVFGRIGDRIGRARTLSLTILTYALFTGLTFFAQKWWHLLFFRFIAALGIGGEWAAGSALVSETWHERHRAWASALLQSGYMVGMIVAAFTANRWMAALEPRYVFIVGVVPALATFWIRKAVQEPSEWKGELERKSVPSISQLFKRGVLHTTLLTLTLCSIALTTVWAFLYFAPQTIQTLGKELAMDKAAIAKVAFSLTIGYTLWNIAGNFFATYLSKLAGFRLAFLIMITGAFASFFFGFRETRTLDELALWFNLCAFFSLGIFGIFPLYIPPLFPTLLRTTGAGFSYNFGRVISGVVLIYLGLGAAKVSPMNAIYLVGFLYLPGLAVALFMPELPKQSSQEPEEAAAMV